MYYQRYTVFVNVTGRRGNVTTAGKQGKKIIGADLFEVALRKKTIRSGKGKLRGRKYKKNAGLLLVIGEREKLKTKQIEIVNVKKLGINSLAKGGMGRLVIYTENAIKDLGELIK